MSQHERHFLARPRRRLVELRRAPRIFAELIRGFRRLHFVGPCVTVFGSARFGEDSPYYPTARGTGALLARAGFTVMTGGGPGIMEAANRGASEAGGRSIGCNALLLFRLVDAAEFTISRGSWSPTTLSAPRSTSPCEPAPAWARRWQLRPTWLLGERGA